MKPKVAMITTWNSKCGIAEYSRFLCNEIIDLIELTIYPNYGVDIIKDDECYVADRLWHSSFEGDLTNLINELDDKYDIIHIQFQYSFYKLKDLALLINSLYNKSKIIITFHKTKDAKIGENIYSLQRIYESLNHCYKLVVHTEDDKARLIGMKIENDKIDIIPHGQLSYPHVEQSIASSDFNFKRSLILGSYGFLFPNKGIKENIEAVSILKESYPDILYIVSCAVNEVPASQKYLQECLNATKKFDLQDNVIFITDFLSNDLSIKYLQACNIILMTYHPSDESASGAIRLCLASYRPIITTQQEFFNEFIDCTYQITKCEPGLIAEAITKISTHPQITKKMLNNLNQQIYETKWSKIGIILYNLYVSN